MGTVAEVKRDPAQSLADVDVRPAAALDRSRELMFVWLKPAAAAPGNAPPAGAATAPTAAGVPAQAAGRGHHRRRTRGRRHGSGRRQRCGARRPGTDRR